METNSEPLAKDDQNAAAATPLEQSFSRAVQIMERLRAPGGCPWDREQTFDTIRRYTLEETYEVLDAIERRDWRGLKDELGDLLLQVLFYAEMAAEEQYFELQDVIENLSAKLIRRHPHVFDGRTGVATSEQVSKNWNEIKKSERSERGDAEPDSLLDAIPRNLPALIEASKLGSKAASIGFDWEDAASALDKLHEEIGELREAMVAADGGSGAVDAAKQEEMGDVLFTAANLARKLGLDAEFTLRAANVKFRRRFHEMESSSAPLERLSSGELEELWNRAKARERQESTR